MSQSIGQEFLTQIPALSDNANIQEAFRLYHYGIATEPDEGTPIAANSIEAHLKTLAQNILNIENNQSSVSTLDGQNLNDITSGTWQKSTTPASNLNYPTLYPGILVVIGTGGAVYQTYQTVGGSSGTNNRFWRGRTSTVGDWSDWKQISSEGHTHDSRYYTESEIDAKISTSMTANTVAVLDSTGKITSSASINTTELNYLDGVTSNIQTQLNNRYTKSETARIFVQQAQPSSPQAGDLWIW